MRYLKVINDIFFDRVNRTLISFFGKKWNVLLINEFPKCGASWVRMMLSDYMGVEPSNGNNDKNGWMGLLSRNAIVQRHWLNRGFNVAKTILIVRDPRDVYNSYYFHETYFKPRERFLKVYGYSPEEDDQLNMTKYIDNKLNNPKASPPGFTYKDFWNSYKAEKNLLVIKYEDLHSDVKGELIAMLKYIGVEEIDEQKVDFVIEKNSFKNMAKRKKGVENKKSHARKGVVGDWRNNYSQETDEVVEKELSTLIGELGYKI